MINKLNFTLAFQVYLIAKSFTQCDVKRCKSWFTSERLIFVGPNKLRLALANDDFVYGFTINCNRVSRLFHEWVDVMSRELKQLIVWPDQQMIREILQCFKCHYPRATCIIDCSEVFIERATSCSARSETYSHYKVITLLSSSGHQPYRSYHFYFFLFLNAGVVVYQISSLHLKWLS